MHIDISKGRILRLCSTVPPHEHTDTLYVFDEETKTYVKMIISTVAEEEALSNPIFEAKGQSCVYSSIHVNDLPKEDTCTPPLPNTGGDSQL